MLTEPEKEQCPVCHGTGTVTEIEVHEYRTHDKEVKIQKGCKYCNETGVVKPIQVFYTKKKYIELMIDTRTITIESMKETHVKMPYFYTFGTLSLKTPDDVFILLNDGAGIPNPYSTEDNQDYIREVGTHTSMSVGDIVRINGEFYVCMFYVCEGTGWRKL